MKHGLKIQGRISGELYVSRDVQKRLYPGGGWVVLRQGDGTEMGDTIQRGLFWLQEDAQLFLKCLKELER